MITVRNPNARLTDAATGQPTQGFAGRPIDEFEVQVRFLGDKPVGGCNYAWDVDPPYSVEWLDDRFEWKRKFRILEHGRLRCVLTDENGFTYDVPSVAIRANKSTGTDTNPAGI